MTQFEYYSANISTDTFEKELTDLGLAGWELVQMEFSSTGLSNTPKSYHYCIFKRVHNPVIMD